MSEGIAPDTVIGGRYRIRRLLGRGGMGLVYEAEHTSLGRVVALKMLVPEAVADGAAVMRFFQEARAAAAIGHPGIVEIFDLSQPDEAPFLAMEKLEGEELTKYVARTQPMAPATVMALGIELCEAVGAAHQHGIVHRDLKPDNVFIARRGDREQVKVLDFGIAKLMRSTDLALTQTGQVVGTPLYMSPEQMRNANVDARSDVYSIGAILYECLAGRPPFDGENITEIIVKVTSDLPAPMRTLRPDVPVALDALLDACLQKDPARRPADANALAAALRQAQAGAGTPPPMYGLMSPMTPAPGAPAGYLPTNPAAVSPTDPMRGGFPSASGGPFGSAPGSSPIVMGPSSVHTPPVYTAPYAAPRSSSSGTGVGCMILGVLGALAIVGVIGAGGVIWMMSAKPPADGPIEGPGGPFGGPVEIPGREVRAPEPPPPPPAEHELLSAKINPLISSCLNRYSRQALSSRDRYFSWCDRDTGPTGQERRIYGLYTLTDETGQQCVDAVRTSNALEPRRPELEAAATRYANAVAALAPTLGHAERYYERETYRDDAMARGRELHASLVPQFDEMLAAHQALRPLVRAEEARARELRIAAFTGDPARATEYVHERFVQQAVAVADIMETLFMEDRRLRAPDRDALYAAVAELERRNEEVRGHTPQRELWDWDGYQDDAEELVAKALQTMRAVRDETVFSDWDVRSIGTFSGHSVDGSPDAYLWAYNRFISSHGTLR